MGIFNREKDDDCGKKPLFGKKKKALYSECVENSKEKKALAKSSVENTNQKDNIKNIVIISISAILLVVLVVALKNKNK